MISVYKHLTSNNLTDGDIESIERYVKLIQWGRSHPVQFIELALGVPLMDYQRWLVSMTWAAEYAVWVCSRNAGKSFLFGNFVAARGLLFPKQKIHIMSSVSRQANETFETMENIVKRNITSLQTINTVFIDELVKSNANTDGFTHDVKKGNACMLANGSTINSVVGTAKTVRGKRSTCNGYDEAGSIDKEFFDVTEPFMAQSSEFSMTDDSVNRRTLPKGVPNLRLYIGSASDTGSEFYGKYRECFKQMLAGNPAYFAADINCDIPLAPTRNGQPMTPLLYKEEIERKMRENEILANREYRNIFDRFNLEDSLVTRSDIRENIGEFPPAVMFNGFNRKYIICYDPASRRDNSPVLIGDVHKTIHGYYEGRVLNMVNLVRQYADGSKKPMTIEEQVDTLRKLIWNYNGKERGIAYENVWVLFDAGTGGQSSALAQEMVKDWVDEAGASHPGLVDENHPDMVRWAEAFPHAIKGQCMMLEPKVYKSRFFEAMKEQISSGHIKFPPECPKHDILVWEDEDGNTKKERKLGRAEKAALVQIDLMKEEAVSIVRQKTPAGNFIYGLPPEKKNRMHDDRAYVLAMFCWWVKQLQIDDILGDGPSIDFEKGYIQKMYERQSHAKATQERIDTPWGKFVGNGRPASRARSPFSGSSPFTK